MSKAAQSLVYLSRLPRDERGWRGSLVERLLREFSGLIIGT
jgi:hypothetical protein